MGQCCCVKNNFSNWFKCAFYSFIGTCIVNTQSISFLLKSIYWTNLMLNGKKCVKHTANKIWNLVKCKRRKKKTYRKTLLTRCGTVYFHNFFFLHFLLQVIISGSALKTIDHYSINRLMQPHFLFRLRIMVRCNENE